MITIQTVTTEIRDALGSLAAGSLTIRPNASWNYDAAAGGQDRVSMTPVTVAITGGKITAVTLPPSKNGGVILTDAAYIVTWTLANTPEWTETWLLDANGAATIELAAVQVIDSSNTLPGLPVAGPKGAPIVTDMTNATVDAAMNIGDVYTYTLAAVTAMPLHVLTQGGVYDLLFTSQTANGTLVDHLALQPNGTTYTNAFLERNTAIDNSLFNAQNIVASEFALTYQGVMHSIVHAVMTTETANKALLGENIATSLFNGTTKIGQQGVLWNDTTTAWSSLGSLVNSGASAMSGTLYVRRLA